MITCPICKTNHDENTLIVYESDCHFAPVENINQHLVRYRCNVCEVIFGPLDMLMLSTEQITNAYRSLYGSGYKEMDATDWEYKIFSTLNPKTNGLYINWGAGTSKTSEMAKMNGYTILNYDPGMPSELGYLSLEEVKSLKVDGIISNNVLDHLQDPISDLLLMKSLLREGGMMVHASDGFRYSVHFTKFHLFFFIGKSSQYISQAIDMNYEFLPSPNPNMDILRMSLKQ